MAILSTFFSILFILLLSPKFVCQTLFDADLRHVLTVLETRFCKENNSNLNKIVKERNDKTLSIISDLL